MTTISIKDYKFKKMEHKYFEFYKYIEEYFDEKKTEQDIMLRLYLAIRYMQDLAMTSHKHIEKGEATESFKKIAKTEANWLKGIAEVLDDEG